MSERRPLLRLAGVCCLAAAVGVGSWFVAAAATDRDTGRPRAREVQPSEITAAVERRVVVRALTGRATVAFTDLVEVTAPDEGGRVTSTPLQEGDPVEEGSVLIEVGGRPVVALVGTTPMYRTLTIGLSGPDVGQFEAALQRLGVSPGPVDGVFDEATEAAVRQFYALFGSDVEEPTPEQRGAYQAAKDAVTQSQLKLLSDTQAVDKDARGPRPAERSQLDDAVATATEGLAKAQRDRWLLEASLDAQATSAADDVARARPVVDDLRAQLDALPDGAPADLRLGLTGQLAQAESALATATAAVADLQRGRSGTLADADALVAQALRAVRNAELARTDALTSEERSVLLQTLEVSRQAVVDAQAELAERAIAVSAAVPVGEVVFVPDLPRRVESVSADVGSPAAGTLMRLSGGDPVGRWFVDDGDRAVLTVGMPVTLADVGSGLSVDGTIASIATEPGDPAAGSSAPSDGESTGSDGGSDTGSGKAVEDGYLVEIALGDGVSDPERLVGRDLQVSVPIEQTSPVLAVPVAAITGDPDGTARVRVDRGDASVDVGVVVGLTGGGYAEVTPQGGATLDEGDRVVVG